MRRFGGPQLAEVSDSSVIIPPMLGDKRARPPIFCSQFGVLLCTIYWWRSRLNPGKIAGGMSEW
jgi:hypothetical protein